MLNCQRNKTDDKNVSYTIVRKKMVFKHRVQTAWENN